MLLVDGIREHGDQVVHASDLLWFGLLLTAQAVMGRPSAARRLALTRSRASALCSVGFIIGGPLVVPLVSRSLGGFGPTVFTLSWPGVLVLVLAAVLATVASVSLPRRPAA